MERYFTIKLRAIKMSTSLLNDLRTCKHILKMQGIPQGFILNTINKAIDELTMKHKYDSQWDSETVNRLLSEHIPITSFNDLKEGTKRTMYFDKINSLHNFD